MKKIACNDVVPGCPFTASAESEEELLQKVAAHAEHSHGVKEASPELLEKVSFHRFGARIRSLGNRLRQSQQAAHAFWQAIVLKLNIPFPAQLGTLPNKCNEA